eukprot:1755437-Pleurochrysis_carterae.AAC.1
MLQPSAYQLDCLRLFGAVLPHSNALAVTDEPSAAFTEWWQAALDGRCPLKGEVPLPDLSVDWDKGIDSCPTLIAEVTATSLEFVEDDAAAEEVLTQYRRYIAAASWAGLQRLSPGAMADLAWHAHQTDPT